MDLHCDPLGRSRRSQCTESARTNLRQHLYLGHTGGRCVLCRHVQGLHDGILFRALVVV